MQYLGANVPQAWAAGSVFHLLRAILGLDADAKKQTLYVNPDLPKWLPEITLHNLRVGNGTVTLRFWREGDTTRQEVLAANGRIHVAADLPDPIERRISWRVIPQREK